MPSMWRAARRLQARPNHESMKDEILRSVALLEVDHFIMRSQRPGLEQDKVFGSIRGWGRFSRPCGEAL